MKRILFAKLVSFGPFLSAAVIVLSGLVLFNNAPTARAAGPNPNAIPPINTQMNAKYVNGIQASKVPAAKKLLPLNASKQFPLSVIPQGPGSGLNADTLDSLDSSAFALAGHEHFGQTWTGAGTLGLKVSSTATSGTSQGLWGEAASTTANSVGVFGVASGTSGSVYGVFGSTSSPQGAGVRAWGAGSGDPALELASGGIRVVGAGIGTNTAVFVQRVTSSNINSSLHYATVIDNSLTDGDPNAILIITPNYNPSATIGGYDNSPVGVYYDGSHWEIFHEDGSTSMTVGDSFNVLVIKP